MTYITLYLRRIRRNNEVEWIRRAAKKAEFLVVQEARESIFWPLPGLKKVTWKGSGFLSRKDPNFCMRDPHLGVRSVSWISFAAPIVTIESCYRYYYCCYWVPLSYCCCVINLISNEFLVLMKSIRGGALQCRNQIALCRKHRATKGSVFKA